MKAFTVKWHPERDETTIEYTTDFVDADRITQLDILKDALFDLETLYNGMLKKMDGTSGSTSSRVPYDH